MQQQVLSPDTIVTAAWTPQIEPRVPTPPPITHTQSPTTGGMVNCHMSDTKS